SDEDIEESERKEYVNHISVSAINLLSIIESILDISLIQTKEMDFYFQPVEVSDIIKNVILESELQQNLLFENIFFEKPIFIPDAGVIIRCDRLRLEQAINNIINNAFRYTKKGKVSFNIKQHNGSITFIIEDTGIGIPKDQINNIFSQFIQLDDSVSKKHGGTGIGLTISKFIIEEMGGNITCESEEGKGSVFKISFPITKEIDTTKKDVEKSSLKNILNGAKILIAEDIDSNFDYLKVLLERHGGVPIRVFDGSEAVEYIKKKNSIDIILMDIQMPVMDGFEATETIRKFSEIPIIAVSAFTLNKEKEKSYNIGCNEYITKPVKPNELLNLLEKYMEKIKK
ncbi:MAG: ATP-binding protein, partial [Bacteroidota bacterium]|nr:ATP-binding protein [Bacteroidota bacterium]